MMKKIIPLALCAVLLSFCSEEKKLLRKASTAVDQSNFDKAIAYYDQIIHKNENSYFGNAGKGIVLSEFMGRHEAAIPYLEKALSSSPPDKSKPVIHGNLGRSYHFIGNFKRALEYYGKLDNDPDYSDYDEFLTKRIADCKYALDHPEIALPENQSVTNLGPTINTSDPEYTPVFTNGKLYFTTKRADTEGEKKNGLDGKWFESVYVSELQGGNWTTPHKIELGETPGLNKKYGEAVASASTDGKELYIYKGGKLWKTNMDDPGHQMEEMDKTVNFANLQNHVSISPDGNTMFLSSESDKGRGGSDIFYCERQPDGSWGPAQPLDFTINTPYDEEAPFMNENGVLFFSSNGHPGYGGFDVYKTKKVNGQWTKPQNLGQPINSPGDDIFFALMPKSSKGYFASARSGGHGDLDIYKIHYIDTDVPECRPAQEILAINATPQQSNPLAYNVQLVIPEEHKAGIRSYAWSVNGQPIGEGKDNFSYTFMKPDTYVLTAMVVSACDTCPQLDAWCVEKTLEVKQTILASNESTDQSRQKSITKNNRQQNQTTKAGEKNQAVAKSGSKSATGTAENHRTLSENELSSLNWNNEPFLFELNQSEVTESLHGPLDQNITVLKTNPELKVVIIGHADSRGSEAYNKGLSLRRAQSVKKYFTDHGVKANQIKAVQGKGEEQLVNGCTDDADCDESQHAQNRRVEIQVIGNGESGITQR